MNIKKIDPALMQKSLTAGTNKLCCLVRASNFDQLKKLLLNRKIEIMDEYLFINSFFVKADISDIYFLSRMGAVRFISSNAEAMALMNVARRVLNLPQNELTGEGVGAAIIDTGITKHCDFCLGENRIKKFVDFVGEKESAYDDNGHGTFVAGVLAGSGAKSAGRLKGIAPRANIYALKALDKNGEAYSNKILSAMEWVYDHHKKENIKVVCMSFGSEPLGLNDPIMNGAEALWQDGVIVVAAAGNSGPEHASIKSPGVSRRLITVGGMNDNRFSDSIYSPQFFEIADFSSRGPSFKSFKPDIVAPAVEISSCCNSGEYTKLSGTSVATPMIAGAMCLLIQRYKDITPDEAKRRLMSCCRPICYNKNLEGAGYPDLTQLLN